MARKFTAGIVFAGATGLKTGQDLEDLIELAVPEVDLTDDSTLTVASDVVKVKDGGIAATQLASNAVTTAKILDGAVTTDKLADDSVTAAKLADNAVVAANIADGTITMAKIRRSTVNTFPPSGLAADVEAIYGVLSGAVAKVSDGGAAPGHDIYLFVTFTTAGMGVINGINLHISANSDMSGSVLLAQQQLFGVSASESFTVVGPIPYGHYFKLTINSGTPTYLSGYYFLRG